MNKRKLLRQKESEVLKKLFNRVRSEKNLNYGTMAVLMGLGIENRSQVSAMMNGHNTINLVRAQQFADILDIAINEFSPRLAFEESEVARRTIGKVQGAAGSVNCLLGLEMDVVKAVLKKRKTVENTVYWPGKHSQHSYMVRVEGSANDPELLSGAAAVIDAERQPESGELFAFLDGALKFARWNGDGYAEYCNLDYPDRVFKVTNKITVIGKVIGQFVEY